jgi:hypothetical protein
MNQQLKQELRESLDSLIVNSQYLAHVIREGNTERAQNVALECLQDTNALIALLKDVI